MANIQANKAMVICDLKVEKDACTILFYYQVRRFES